MFALNLWRAGEVVETTMPDIDESGDGTVPSFPGLQSTTCLGQPPSEPSCPPEYADVPIRTLFDQIDAGRRQRAAAAAKESLAAGFQSRAESPSSRPGTGFESGGALDTQLPDGMLAVLTDAAARDGGLAELNDDELIGVLGGWHRRGVVWPYCVA